MQTHRRKYLPSALGLLAAALTCCGDPELSLPRDEPAGQSGAAEYEPPAGTDRPNVLLIVLDTTRADRCSVNGYGRPTTPALEGLAAEGIRFGNCWSPSPWTAPAHASLFTGLRPARHGLMGDRNRFHLAEESRTLAELLRASGYATACFTANDFIRPQFGLTQGFESFWGAWEGHDDVYPVADYTHRLGFHWAQERHREGKPFFLFLNDIEPHAPYQPQPPHRERFAAARTTQDEFDDAAQFQAPRTNAFTFGAREETPRFLQLVSDLYDGEIATVDATLAPLFAALRDAGILDETVVIVTSDHGENLGERRMAEHAFSCNRSVLHVPLVIRYPPAFEPGTVVDDLVRLEDLFPTVLDLCGVPVPDGIDALSLLRDLPGRIARADYGGANNTVDVAARRFPGLDLRRFRVSMRSVFDGRHHLIEHSDGALEFYDVDSDPLELQNAAPSNTAAIERLRALFED